MRMIQKIIVQFIQNHIQRGDIEKALAKTNYLRRPQERYYYQGVCYFELGNLAKAQEELENALTVSDESEAVVQILVQVYMFQRKWDQAFKMLIPYQTRPEAQHMIKILNQGEDSCQAYLNYMSLVRKSLKMLRSRNYEAAIACLQSALPHTEEKAKIYDQIGAIYFNYLKDYRKAESYFAKAYAILPNDKRIKMNYAKAKLT